MHIVIDVTPDEYRNLHDLAKYTHMRIEEFVHECIVEDLREIHGIDITKSVIKKYRDKDTGVEI